MGCGLTNTDGYLLLVKILEMSRQLGDNLLRLVCGHIQRMQMLAD